MGTKMNEKVFSYKFVSQMIFLFIDELKSSSVCGTGFPNGLLFDDFRVILG